MHKPNLVACLVILLTFSAPALAGDAPGSTGAPGSSGYPGGGAPGAAASSPTATVSPSTGSGAGAAAQGGEQKGGPQGGAPAPMTPEKLAEVKAMLGKRLDTIIDDLQKRRECIRAAANQRRPPGLHHAWSRRPRGMGGGRPQASRKSRNRNHITIRQNRRLEIRSPVLYFKACALKADQG